MEKDPFKEYMRESEPDKAHKGYAWSTAIGLQAVDGRNYSSSCGVYFKIMANPYFRRGKYENNSGIFY